MCLSIVCDYGGVNIGSKTLDFVVTYVLAVLLASMNEGYESQSSELSTSTSTMTR